jgi:hypothetical protein
LKLVPDPNSFCPVDGLGGADFDAGRRVKTPSFGHASLVLALQQPRLIIPLTAITSAFSLVAHAGAAIKLHAVD